MKTFHFSLIIIAILVLGNSVVFAQTNESAPEPREVKDWLATHPHFSGCVHTNLKTGESKEISCIHPELSPMGMYEPQNNTHVMSPLKQFKSGILPNHIICKKDLYVILKAENSFPACVSIETGKKLALRGWATTFGTSMNDYWSTCDKSFPQSDSGTSVLYMPVNSIGKICLRYSNLNNEPEPVTPPGISDPNNSYQKPKDIAIWTYTPISTISKDNGTTIAYFIKTGNQSGFYGLSLPSCGEIPFAVGYDNNSTITTSNFPFLEVAVSCPPGMLYPQIDGIEGIGVKYIP